MHLFDCTKTHLCDLVQLQQGKAHMLDPFYGRERELGILEELLDSKVARLVVLRGRRRIGKSRLAEKFEESYDKHFTFVGLPPEKGVRSS
jgi:uncharacterized protein